MRILIVGTGGVGGYYGARLAVAGNDVRFLARGAMLAALQADGLTVRGDQGDVRLPEVSATDRWSDEDGSVDAAVICVKTYDNEEAAGAVAAAIRPGTAVVSLQNGIDNEPFLRDRFPGAIVLGGTSRLEAFVESPGVVVQLGQQHDVTIGAFRDAERTHAEELAAAMGEAGVPATVADDVEAALWTKLVIISGVGSITAYARAPIGEVLADAETARLLQDLLHETEAVALASGIAVQPGTADLVLAYAGAQLDPAFRSSMARDVERGRPLEVESINGAVVRHGERAAVPTPANRRVLDELLPLHRTALVRRRSFL